MAVYIKFSDGNERCYRDGVKLLGCTWASDLGYRPAIQYGLRSYVDPDAVLEAGAPEVMPDEVTLIRVKQVEEIKVDHYAEKQPRRREFI